MYMAEVKSVVNPLYNGWFQERVDGQLWSKRNDS